ncbi:MAG: AI-2E family transporter [Eubacterium sp.]|nr:AI-2E family transporter [Eubacterium sp.]
MDKEKHTFSWKETALRGMTALFVLISAIVFFFLIYKIEPILSFFGRIVSILMPIILGCALAYLLNPLVVAAERFLSVKVLADLKRPASAKKKAGLARILAIIVSFAFLFLAIYVVLVLVIPQIYVNIRNLIYALPGQVTAFMNWITAMSENNEELNRLIRQAYSEGMNFLTNWMKTDMLDQVGVVISGVVGVFNTLLDCLVGVIVAVYVLMSKETFKRQTKKLIYAFLNDRQAELVIDVLKQSDRIFGGFISGKLVDSLIIGILCFIGCLILKLPYAVLVSVIVGVTNVIPFFGPYIGATPSSILILLASPSKGLIFIVFIFLLQQLDGNVIGPKILGESTGLSPFWVVFAILLGGGLFGIVGMLVGVPVFAVFYYLVKRFINYLLREKGKKI